MTTEYKMHIDIEKKAQPTVVFLYYPIQCICAIVCFILSLICIGLGLAFSLELLKWGIVVYFPAALLIAFLINKLGRRTRALSRLYRSHETKVFTFSLTDNNGVIRDFCNETRQGFEEKRANIRRIIKTKRLIYVIYQNEMISTYPRTKQILEFFGEK
jgi:hypothetical protein